MTSTLSPEGNRFVFDSSANGKQGDIWIRDLVRGVTSRFTFDTGQSLSPVWSPDGRTILYTSKAKGPGDLWTKDVSGTREPEPLLASPEAKFASDWSPRREVRRSTPYQAKTTGSTSGRCR